MMWGTTYAVTTQLLPPGRPLLAATARALVAGLVLLAVVRRLPVGRWWWRCAVLGALNIGGFFALLFLSASRLPGGFAAVLASCQPLVVLALTPFVLGDAVRLRQVAYAVAGVSGIALLVIRATSTPDMIGMVAALGAGGSSAIGLLLTRRWRPPVGAWTLTAWQLTAGGLLLLPLLITAEGLPHAVTTHAALGFVWLIGPSTIGGYYLWFDGLNRLPVSAVSALGMLSPITAGAVGAMWLHQSLSTGQVVGAAIALSSALLLQLERRNHRGSRSPSRRRDARCARVTVPRAEGASIEEPVAPQQRSRDRSSSV
jgi:probable blue pigment (indigoidine) exporter